MIAKRAFGATAVTIGLSWPAAANAQPIDNAGQADVAFKEAMQLRDAGQYAEACPKFARSRRLAPGVGVTLYLADCYERTGRTASAWQEFRAGEKLAREREDKRAAIAGQRATALEPKLNRLTLAAPAADAKAGAEVLLDGSRLSPEALNVPLAVDPGDHVVTVAAPGQALQTFSVHVDASTPSTILRLAPDAGAAATPAVVPAAPGATESATASNPRTTAATARWAAGGLMVAGAVGIGVGTWLVTDKTQEVMNGKLCDPQLRPNAVPEAVVAFAAGGVALVSGVVLYYVNRPGRAELSLGPAFVPGGGGGVLRGSF